MNPNTITPSRISFGLFEVDLKSGELWKAGYRVKLQSQPFKVLIVLLENAGEVVSREELQLRVWGPDVIVDFEHSLGSAIKKVREALGDSAENPRFVETLARRGYRFIAPVNSNGAAFQSAQIVSLSQPVAFTNVESPSINEAVSRPPDAVASQQLHNGTEINQGRWPFATSKWAMYSIPLLCFAAGTLLTVAVFDLWNARHPALLPRIAQITQEGQIYSPVDPSLETLPASATDGARLFTSTVANGRVVLSQVSLSTGEIQALPLPSEIGAPEINDISPDGSKLIVRSHLSAASAEPLWVVPIDGGSAFKVSNVIAEDATWMPDGKNILYSYENHLNVVSLESGKSTPFATIHGRAFWLRWSPDGKLLRFTVIDPMNHMSSLWQISMDQSSARPILDNWSYPHNECCGTWTSDGKFFVFQATKDGHTDLWKLSDSFSRPVRVTNGPLNYEAPAAGRNGDTIFFVGSGSHSMLEQYDTERKQFTPLRDFLAGASRVSFSRDRQMVAWTDAVGHLWRAHTDGTDKVRLTADSMSVFMAAWSPDGTHLALMARRQAEAWQIYMVGVDGGNLELVLPQARNVGDPSFSKDGKFLVFGGVPDLMGQVSMSRSLGLLELTTKKVTEIPGSQGLFSPRWSPDGRYIAAMTLDEKKVMLYDVAAQTWKVLAVTSTADPVWTSDSKSLYIHAYMAQTEPLYRVSIPDGRMVEVANLNSFPVGSTGQYVFSGVTPDNIPLVHAEIPSNNIYTTNLDPQRAR